MTCDKDAHEFVQEVLARAVIREESVSVDIVQLTLAWVREAKLKIVFVLCGI